ncbi:MAG: DUF421 domain-containing protein [Chloroflexi bacterium]|mgnify:CR=1 FL=1|nr:DUF421 domain-containing protein [Chloroflexota bacterium]
METVIRIIIIYMFILLGLRLMGKREFSQLSPLELVNLLLIPEIVSQSIVREDFSLINGLIGISTIFALVFFNSALVHRSKRYEQVIESSPTVLVYHGQLAPDNMNAERIMPEEVFAEMHKSGLERLEQVAWAILEPDGKIAIVPEQQSGGGQHHDQQLVG